MNEARLILEMLQEGKITIDEAERLLAALRESGQSAATEEEPPREEPEGPWVELGAVIGGCVDEEMRRVRMHLRRVKQELRNAHWRARMEAGRAREEAQRECARAREEWRRGMRVFWQWTNDPDAD
jgi:hypothetical protein